MNKVKIIATILILVFVAAAVWGASEICSLKSQLSDSRAELSRSESDLSDLEAEFAEFQFNKEIELAETNSELKDLQGKFIVKGAELEAATLQLQIAKLEINNQKIHYEQKIFEEFERGREEGYLSALDMEIDLRDPTYEEAVELAYGTDYFSAFQDKKEEGRGFVCVDFAEALSEAGRAAGIRTGTVFLVFRDDYEGKWGHFLNCFETSDQGLVFFDAMYGIESSRVKEGRAYLGDMVKEVIIYW